MKNLIRNLIKDKGLRIQHKSAGFTLIELLVVIAIICILSSVVLVSLQSTRAKAKDSSAMISMSSISAAAELYYSNNSDYGTDNNTSTSTGGSPSTPTGEGICGYDEVTKLMIAVSKQMPGTVTCKVGTKGQSYTVDTPLNTGNFCVDSDGFSGKGTASGNDNDVGVECAPFLKKI